MAIHSLCSFLAAFLIFIIDFAFRIRDRFVFRPIYYFLFWGEPFLEHIKATNQATRVLQAWYWARPVIDSEAPTTATIDLLLSTNNTCYWLEV